MQEWYLTQENCNNGRAQGLVRSLYALIWHGRAIQITPCVLQPSHSPACRCRLLMCTYDAAWLILPVLDSFIIGEAEGRYPPDLFGLCGRAW